MHEITLKIKPDSNNYTDVDNSYDALDISEFHHYQIYNSDVFVDENTVLMELITPGTRLNEYYESTTG